MRYLIGSQMDLIAVPFIVLAGVAYAWVMERLLSRKSNVAMPMETSGVQKVA